MRANIPDFKNMFRLCVIIFFVFGSVLFAQESVPSIDQKLEGIFQQIPKLSEVAVEESEGVVTLSGKVTSAELAEEAVALAEKQDGVVWVRNEVEVPLGVESRINPAYEKIQEIGSAIVAYLPLLGVALIVLLFFRWIGRLLAEAEWWKHRLGLSSLGVVLAKRVIRLLGLLVGLLLALEILDATAIVGAILGVAGVAGIALGFAFRNIVENYLAGIMLSARNPFEMGDAIEVAGKSGTVARLTSRDTVLISFDGNHVRLPNSVVINSELTNFSRNPRRRFEVRVDTEPTTDLRLALSIGVDTIKSIRGVLPDPAPKGVVESLGDSTVKLVFFVWLDQRESDLLKLRGEATVRVKEAFDANQVGMPEPTYRIINVHPESMSDNEKAKQEPVPQSSEGGDADVSRDESLDKTLEEEMKRDDEENLL